MNGNRLLVDTNIIIFCSIGDLGAFEAIKGNEVCIASISKIELLGYPNISVPESKLIQTLISHLTKLPLTDEVIDFAIFLRKEYALSTPDSVIASTSYINNVPLLTADNDFKKVKEIELIKYNPT